MKTGSSARLGAFKTMLAGLIGALIVSTGVVFVAPSATAVHGPVATTGQPTLTVHPVTGLVGNKRVHIAGGGWIPVTTVRVDLCQEPNPVFGPGTCVQIASKKPTRGGTWNVSVAPSVGGPSPVCGASEFSLTVATQCSIEATQNSTQITAQLTYSTPSVELVPIEGGDGYYDAQRVSVKVTNFPSNDPVTIELCVPSSLVTNCNLEASKSGVTNGWGRTSFRSFLLTFGGDSTTGRGECDLDGSCAIVAVDTRYGVFQSSAAEIFPIYCGPIVCGGFGGRRH